MSKINQVQTIIQNTHAGFLPQVYKLVLMFKIIMLTRNVYFNKLLEMLIIKYSGEQVCWNITTNLLSTSIY